MQYLTKRKEIQRKQGKAYRMLAALYFSFLFPSYSFFFAPNRKWPKLVRSVKRKKKEGRNFFFMMFVSKGQKKGKCRGVNQRTETPHAHTHTHTATDCLHYYRQTSDVVKKKSLVTSWKFASTLLYYYILKEKIQIW